MRLDAPLVEFVRCRHDRRGKRGSGRRRVAGLVRFRVWYSLDEDWQPGGHHHLYRLSADVEGHKISAGSRSISQPPTKYGDLGVGYSETTAGQTHKVHTQNVDLFESKTFTREQPR